MRKPSRINTLYIVFQSLYMYLPVIKFSAQWISSQRHQWNEQWQISACSADIQDVANCTEEQRPQHTEWMYITGIHTTTCITGVSGPIYIAELRHYISRWPVHVMVTHTWIQSLKMCPRMWERGGVWTRASCRYSSAILQHGGCSPVKRAGLNRFPST